MIGAQLCVRPIVGAAVGPLTDPADWSRWIASSHSYSSICQLGLKSRKWCKVLRLVSVKISCKSSRGSFSHKSNNSEARDDDDDDTYVEAMVLLSETVRHYRMLMPGFQVETKWQSSAQLFPFSLQVKDPRADISSIGLGFLRRFQNPTIFLKISCDGDFVLPIIVGILIYDYFLFHFTFAHDKFFTLTAVSGESAVKKLIYSAHEDEPRDFPDQFQLVRDLLQRLGYEVKMVRITERVVNTYFARIYFHKPGEKETLSVDARPSDAINIARRCMAPIFINKHIILTDAIRIAYGMSRTGNVKSTYDVSLDSAADGPDILTEELNLVRNMDIAAKEERYSDAAMWKDKLKELREKHKF